MDDVQNTVDTFTNRFLETAEEPGAPLLTASSVQGRRSCAQAFQNAIAVVGLKSFDERFEDGAGWREAIVGLNKVQGAVQGPIHFED